MPANIILTSRKLHKNRFYRYKHVSVSTHICHLYIWAPDNRKYVLRWAREALASVMLTDQCPASHKLLPHSHHIACSQEVLQDPGMDRKELCHSLKLSKGHCCLYLRGLQKEIWPLTQNLNDIAHYQICRQVLLVPLSCHLQSESPT